MTEDDVKLTPGEWVRAVGFSTFNVAWCAGWLVWYQFHFHGWARVVMTILFGALLVLSVVTWRRNLRSYRRMVASTRRLGEKRARFLATAVVNGWPVDVVLRVDSLLMEGDWPSARALLEEHRPAPRLLPWWPRPPRL